MQNKKIQKLNRITIRKLIWTTFLILILNNIINFSGTTYDIENTEEPVSSDELVITESNIYMYYDSGSGTLLDPWNIENREFEMDVKLSSINSFSHYIVFRNCTFNFRLQLSGCKNLNITNSTFGHNNRGIWLVESHSNNIYNNIFNNCSIDMDYSTNNLIELNNFTFGGIRLYIDYFAFIRSENCHNRIRNNLANGKQILYFEDESNIVIDNVLDIGQIILFNCTYFTISNLKIEDTFAGIQLHFCTNILLDNNSISNSYTGILLNYGKSNTISNCNLRDNDAAGILSLHKPWMENANLIINNTIYQETIDSNGYGILLWGSSDNVIENNTCFQTRGGIRIADRSNDNIIRYNTVFNNSGYGFYLLYADRTTLSECISFNNMYGIHVEISFNSTIENCNVFNNSIYGFYLDRNNDCEFKFNNISQNRNGFYIDEDSENNLIWQNYFLNNTEYQAVDDGIGNKWNNTTMGNYWSDFNYNDIYYQIAGTANSTDFYPLNLIEDQQGENGENRDDNSIIGYSGLQILALIFISSYIIYKKTKKKDN